MKYVYLDKEDFGFKDSKINKILETDIKIKEEIYNKFFKEQAQGKKFKMRNLKGKTFDEIFEEVIPVPVDPRKIEPSPIEELQAENAELKKQVEDTQKSMAEIMNLIAKKATP